jgi:hypothetical protein
MMNVEQLVEWRLAGETEVLGENLPQCYIVQHKSHMTWPGFEPGAPRWETSAKPPEVWQGLMSNIIATLYFSVPILETRFAASVSTMEFTVTAMQEVLKISKNWRPLLRNGSVDTFPWQQISMQQWNGVFCWSVPKCYQWNKFRA